MLLHENTAPHLCTAFYLQDFSIFFLVCIFFYVFSIYLLMYLMDSKLTFSIAEFHDFKERWFMTVYICGGTSYVNKQKNIIHFKNHPEFNLFNSNLYFFWYN